MNAVAKEARKQANIAAAARRLAFRQMVDKIRTLGYTGSDTEVLDAFDEAQKGFWVEEQIAKGGTPLVRFLAGRQNHQPYGKVVGHILRFKPRKAA
jgi:hypothetical protein